MSAAHDLYENDRITAVNHKKLAGCNFGETTDSCMEVGIGPTELDCSGFVITALAQVHGFAATSWSPELRHVRQMYHCANEPPDNLTPGELLVLGRTYDFPGGRQLRPAHIGIVTDVRDEGFILLHAQASKKRIVRSTLNRSNPNRLGKIMGKISTAELLN